MTGFHDDFARAMDGDLEAMRRRLGDDPLSVQALAVYRNTSLKGRIDALAANYPTVRTLVGDAWLQAAARAFVEDQPGDDPAMAAYGEGFPAWLAEFEPARALAYLAPIARLDRAWTEAHLAADSRPLTPDRAAALGFALAGRVLRPRPDVRLFQFDWTAPSLWLAHREPTEAELTWAPETEALLIHRPQDTVRHRRLAPREITFLRACARGRPLAVAALEAGLAPGMSDGVVAALIAEALFLEPDVETPA